MARDSFWTWGRGSPIPQSLRQKIVEQDQKGVSQRKIAKSLRLSSSTVHNIIQRFRESGTTSVRKGQGRKTILNARDLRVLEQHCIAHRDATVMEITKWAQEHFQKTLSVNTIHRAIRRCQISQKKILEEKMGKDPVKLKGKMSSYAYFVLTCREEHKKKHPEALVNLDEFLKKCSERWKTMSVEEKDRFEEMAKQDKGCYERKMKNSIRPKGEKKRRFKDPSAPKRPPSAFFIFCSEYRPKVKAETPGLSIRDVAKRMGEMWSKLSFDEKQPYEKKAATLKEKYEKDIAAYQQPPANADQKDNEDDDDDDKEEDNEDDNDDDDKEEDDYEEDYEEEDDE